MARKPRDRQKVGYARDVQWAQRLRSALTLDANLSTQQHQEMCAGLDVVIRGLRPLMLEGVKPNLTFDPMRAQKRVGGAKKAKK